MSDDIVARLRERAGLTPSGLMDEAADEIERLRETDRLRETAFQCYVDEQKKDRAEIERLREENLRLYSAVNSISAITGYFEEIREKITAIESVRHCHLTERSHDRHR